MRVEGERGSGGDGCIYAPKTYFALFLFQIVSKTFGGGEGVYRPPPQICPCVEKRSFDIDGISN